MTTQQNIIEAVASAQKKFPVYAEKPAVFVSIKEQKLFLVKNGTIESSYLVSTSKNGVGQEMDSYKTPLGVHCVKDKIGEDVKFAEIFEQRKRTHQIASIEPQEICTNEDLITSRILWLSGLEEGFNCGNGVDSYERYIYIHGTHEEGMIGKPASIGCIRMKNKDVMELFDEINTGSLVVIAE